MKYKDLKILDGVGWAEFALAMQIIEEHQKREAMLREAITKAVNDEESGTGWGPDVTVCAYLQDALNATKEEPSV